MFDKAATTKLTAIAKPPKSPLAPLTAAQEVNPEGYSQLRELVTAL